MSPVLPEPKMLAGQWVVSEQGSGASCSLVLTLRPAGNGHAAEHDGKCLGGLRLAGVALWRTAPDGIGLADASGRTVAFFSRGDGAYVLRRPKCAPLVLSRRAS